jgi:hypothetical protein
MHDSRTDGDDHPSSDSPSPGASGVAATGLSAADYLRPAQECLSLASLTKDPEEAAELVKTSDDYLRRAAKWIADQLEKH